ncbi:Clavaminate synthase-like protein [Penicillium waksmanii]|uniref:Clavaminate synthase-like protein n=1 Tax=Penicillium waksmanii TaxID=69791 RepID=UPI0025484CAA|nr:Clavaminate synthase-like protein [Penicillium waksmanii]KAJ6000861.1 Clavaminate synthase-like protein [Penicillium waksmanii]
MSNTHQIPHEFGADLKMAHLETVDLARIVTGDSQEKQKLYNAATRPGAFFLDFKSRDEGILDDLPRLYALSDRYFQRPRAEKSTDFREDQPASSDRGYKSSDCDETFEFSDDELFRGDARLPPILHDESELVQKFNKLCHAAAISILSSLSDSLGIEGDKRLEAHHRTTESSDTGLKLIYEPLLAKASEVVENKHTDSGSLTLLFYEQVGLHLYLAEQDRWDFAAVPTPGCALVTVADSLQRLSDLQFHSPLHRVTQPSDGAAKRYFLSYFLRPSHATQGTQGKVAME